MNILVKLITLAAVLALLSGCAQENVKQMLSNLDKDCVRDYQGSFGGTLSTPTITFNIHCTPNGVPAPGTTTTTVTTPVRP